MNYLTTSVCAKTRGSPYAETTMPVVRKIHNSRSALLAAPRLSVLDRRLPINIGTGDST